MTTTRPLADIDADLASARKALARAQEAIEALTEERLATVLADANGPELAAMSQVEDNYEAQEELQEAARSLHPAIIGYSRYAPVEPAHREAMTLTGCAVDLRGDVDDEYLSSLASAMETFARTYQPDLPAEAQYPGFRFAEVGRGGNLYYEPHSGGSAFMFDFDGNRLDFTTTVEALAYYRNKYAS